MLHNGAPRKEGPLKTVIGEWAEDAPAVLDSLIEAHFLAPHASAASWAKRCNWAKAKKIIILERLRWAISTFEPYKALRGDGIYPALLQKGMRVLALPLCKLLRACLAMGFVPSYWQEARVVFVPKAGRALLQTVKDFRPISLTSFLLKLMEILLDRYIREVPLVENPLRRK